MSLTDTSAQAYKIHSSSLDQVINESVVRHYQEYHL